MMKKCNIRKKTLMLLIVLLSLINNIDYVDARSASTGSSGSDETTGTCPPSGPGSLNCNASKGWTATCSKSWRSEDTQEVVTKIWDMNGNYLGEDIDNSSIEEIFSKNNLQGALAGTYIGLYIYEEKYTYRRIDVNSVGIQEFHDCTYERKYTTTCCSGTSSNGQSNCYSCEKTEYKKLTKQEGTAANACPQGEYWTTGPAYYECVATCTSALEQCRAKNEPTLPDLNPSYKGIFQDSNDVNAGMMEPLEPEITYDTGEESSLGSWFWEKSRTKRFSFKLGSACINVKTGEVRYVSENGNCKLSDDEYTVNESTEYWKYFIPLNANSANDISINLESISGSGIVSAGLCQSYISNYPKEYMNFLKPINGSLTGNQSTDMEKVSSGCYMDTKITLPIIQRFYNELEDGKTFKGFNFYYKPIDINNPFPNGLNNTSIWNEWNGTNPNISQSYDKMIYYANTSGNEQEIRKYNDKNNDKYTPYASWDKLNKDGTSEFVRNSGIMDESKLSLPNKNSFYALGCGPKNSSSQSECGRR